MKKIYLSSKYMLTRLLAGTFVKYQTVAGSQDAWDMALLWVRRVNRNCQECMLYLKGNRNSLDSAVSRIGVLHFTVFLSRKYDRPRGSQRNSCVSGVCRSWCVVIHDLDGSLDLLILILRCLHVFLVC